MFECEEQEDTGVSPDEDLQLYLGFNFQVPLPVRSRPVVCLSEYVSDE